MDLSTMDNDHLLSLIREASGILYSRERKQITNPEIAISHVRAHIGDEMDKQEHFVAIGLDNQHHIVYTKTITKGLSNCTLFGPKEALHDLIINHLDAVIFAHNHPSGDLKPSLADNKMMEVLDKAADIFKIRILDHLIVTPQGGQSVKNWTD